MKLVDVSFGNQTGKTISLKSYFNGLSVGEDYQIIAHKMDEASMSGKHYFVVKNSYGEHVVVPSSYFGF